jgi:uncharacterized protein (DUF302 family)
VALPFDAAVQRTTDELAKVGFGVLAEIDAAAMMKKELSLVLPPYRMLGARIPQYARRASDEPQQP